MDRDRGRIKKTFKATNVSIKLLMFHVYFLKMFRGRTITGEKRSVQSAKAMLDSCMGRPTHSMQIAFQIAVKKIKKVKGWNEFFEWIGFSPPSIPYLSNWLRVSVQNSLRKRYHNPDSIKKAQAKPDKAEGTKQKSKGKKGPALSMGFLDDDDLNLSNNSLDVLNQAERDYGDF